MDKLQNYKLNEDFATILIIFKEGKVQLILKSLVKMTIL